MIKVIMLLVAMSFTSVVQAFDKFDPPTKAEQLKKDQKECDPFFYPIKLSDGRCVQPPNFLNNKKWDDEFEKLNDEFEKK